MIGALADTSKLGSIARGGRMQSSRRHREILCTATLAFGILPAFLTLVASCSGTGNGPPGDASVDAAATEDSMVTDAAVATDGTDGDRPDGDAGAFCDPVIQSCPKPADKCTFVKIGADFVAACVSPGPYLSIRMEGDSCDRMRPGTDDCTKGLVCSPAGTPGQFACRTPCSWDSDCKPGQQCAAVTTLGEPYGICLPVCTPFSMDCGDGTCENGFIDNDGVTTFDACRSIGRGASGSPCSAGSDCAANMNCRGTAGFTCTPQCDAAHACTLGTCMTLQGVPNGGGVCE